MIYVKVEISASIIKINTNNMMGQYGGYSMMGGAGIVGLLLWLVIFVDMILVGIWLWQHISRK